MTNPVIDETIATVRRGLLRIYYRRALSPEAVVEAVEAPGESLKVSGKTFTRRVGRWVVKESRLQGGIGLVKCTFQRARYRQGWLASHFLLRHGVLVPQPHAFIEKGYAGIVLGNIILCEYLDGFLNVEQYARGIEDSRRIAPFLEGLANAVNALTATGAHHTDLSGKNILTRDGKAFYFIDLDGVVLEGVYTTAERMKNHVQLYDSFFDLWGPDVLDPFVTHMCPDVRGKVSWAHAVQAGQQTRRAAHERAGRNRNGSVTASRRR